MTSGMRNSTSSSVVASSFDSAGPVELVSDGCRERGGGEAGEDAGSFRADGKDWIGEDGAEGGQQVGVGQAL